MKTISKRLPALATVGMTLCSHCALAQDYSATEISLGGNSSYASAINDVGQVTGFATNGSGEQHAFVFFNGVITDLGGLYSQGNAINNSGEVVGSLETLSGDTEAFLYSHGAMKIIATDGGVATAINSSGQVTGVAGDTAFIYSNGVKTLGGGTNEGNAINDSGQITGEGNPLNAFLYSDGKVKDLGTLGGNFSNGTAINSSGQVVGCASTVSGLLRAFLYSNGVLHDLGTLGGPQSCAASTNQAVNSSGQVVGSSNTAAGGNPNHAFLYSNGVMQDLGTLGGATSQANAINDAGQVVGSSDTGAVGNPTHAFFYSNGEIADLNALIAGSSVGENVTLTQAEAINIKGLILAYGTNNTTGAQMGYLLTPPQPTVSPIVTGTLGTNGWYVSKITTVKWSVTGNPTPTTSGCGTAYVPQAIGKTYTCSATNSHGSARDSVTIKEDSVAPQVTVSSPVAGATYSLNKKVVASYSCLDATSGVAKCSGTVKDGTSINTSSKGTKTFTVTGTDKAGNHDTDSILYSVN